MRYLYCWIRGNGIFALKSLIVTIIDIIVLLGFQSLLLYFETLENLFPAYCIIQRWLYSVLYLHTLLNYNECLLDVF